MRGRSMELGGGGAGSNWNREKQRDGARPDHKQTENLSHIQRSRLID